MIIKSLNLITKVTVERRQLSKEMSLYVKIFLGKTITFNYKGDVHDITICDLKVLVSDKCGCPVSEVRIVWSGNEMKHGTIGEYKYTNASHSITAVHKPAVMAGGRPESELLAGHQALDHQPSIEYPEDIETLSVEDQIQLVMMLTASIAKPHGPVHQQAIELPQDVLTLSLDEQSQLLEALTTSREVLRR